MKLRRPQHTAHMEGIAPPPFSHKADALSPELHMQTSHEEQLHAMLRLLRRCYSASLAPSAGIEPAL